MLGPDMAAPEAGHSEKSFVLLGTDGVPRTLGESREGPVLTVFFKTTCPTCMLTFQYLERLHQAYAAYGLSVWGISQDPLDESLAFAADQGVTFPLLLDSGWDVSMTYGIETVPTMFLFCPTGDVCYSTTSFCKDDINDISRQVAEMTGAAMVEIAPDGDGKPKFRPG
jgi:peroxiredoxin